MIFTAPPRSFKPAFQVVSCCVLCSGNEALLLHRITTKPHGNTWGFPTGKIELGEDADDAMRRELLEETGIESKPRFFQSVFVAPEDEAHPPFTYHLYVQHLPAKLPIQLSASEHDAYRWVAPEQMEELSLVPDLAACIRLLRESQRVFQIAA